MDEETACQEWQDVTEEHIHWGKGLEKPQAVGQSVVLMQTGGGKEESQVNLQPNHPAQTPAMGSGRHELLHMKKQGAPQSSGQTSAFPQLSLYQVT